MEKIIPEHKEEIYDKYSTDYYIHVFGVFLNKHITGEIVLSEQNIVNIEGVILALKTLKEKTENPNEELVNILNHLIIILLGVD